MGAPQLTYTLSHYVQNQTTGVPTQESFSGMPDVILKFSFKEPYNLLNVTFTPNMSLSYYEVRATKVEDAYGIGVGTRLYYIDSNISSQSNNEFTITFSSKDFNQDGAYRLGFYAKNDTSDGMWDVTYLLISSDSYIIAPSDFDGIEVFADDESPEVS